jgi:hypothetical protein
VAACLDAIHPVGKDNAAGTEAVAAWIVDFGWGDTVLKCPSRNQDTPWFTAGRYVANLTIT